MSNTSLKNTQKVLDDIRRNDVSNFIKHISYINKMPKEIAKECIRLGRWDMLQEWSEHNLKIKKHYWR